VRFHLQSQGAPREIPHRTHVEYRSGQRRAAGPGAVRTADGKLWQIECASLEELADMISTLDEPLILSRRQGPGGLVSIEIYDDMREQSL